jgi:hypothetical protein
MAYFFLQGTDRANTDDPGDTQLLHRPDIGSMVEFTGQNAVTTTVTGQEYDLAIAESPGHEII